MNNLSTIAQLASAVTNIVFVVVIAIGYYMMIRLYRQMVKVYDRMLQVTKDQRTAMGRPQVIVDTNYGDLPQVDLVVRNISQGAAKEISFEFSTPVESSDGTVISDLTYFKEGLDFLAPGGEISCYWDHLDSLLPFLREKGLERGISVTTRYKDLAGKSYKTRWNFKPTIYQEGRYVHPKNMDDLMNALERIAGGIEQQPTARREPRTRRPLRKTGERSTSMSRNGRPLPEVRDG